MQRVRSFARKRQVPREVADLREVIDGTRTMFRAFLPNAPEIECTCDERCHDGARALLDRLSIEQVLLNLCKNAFDGMQSLPPAERRIAIHLSCADDGYRVAVRDNGEGLSPETMQRLFEPFYTTKPNGVGLGLAICKRVIEAHGGHIGAAANAPHPGVTVSFTLPPAPAAAATSAAQRATEAA